MTRTGRHATHELPDPLARAIESAKVPALPQAILRLLVLADDDASTMSELARVVEQDPGLCARILHAANSPGLRRGTELRSVAHCLTSLGTRLIRSIATCISLQSLFESRHEPIRPDLADYWRHSIRVAETAREIATVCGRADPDQSYLAGLLHDIGQLLLLSANGSAYSQLLVGARDEPHLVALESEHLGVHHGEVGAWLVDQWHLDFAIGDSIRFHHATGEKIGSADALAQIVWLAHAVSTVPAADPQRLALTTSMLGTGLAAQLEPIAQRARHRTEQIAQAIGVAPGPAEEVLVVATMPKITRAVPHLPDGAAEVEIDALMRDMSLMQPLQRDLFGVESDAELLRSLRESARILFDLSHLAFFLRGPDDEGFSAARFGEQPALFRRTTIRTDGPCCLVSRAAASGRPLSSFDADYPQPAALIDQQFARVFGTEGLLCVPMNGRRGAVGVLVFGLSAAQHGRLKRRLAWVQNFGRIAALSLEAWHEAINFRSRAEEDASTRFERQARRVIHETGNPLGIIRSYLKVLDSKLSDNASVRAELGILREEIDRVTSIVRRLNETTAALGASLEVGPLLRDLVSFYDVALFRTHGVEAQLTIDGPIDPVHCDRDSLKQILINLWKNASEALPEGGRIDIAVSNGVVQNGRRHVEIRISDNGPGIPATALARLSRHDAIREPGERGIGLSIVGDLTRQIGATITCRSKAGFGSEFSLLIPSSAPSI